MRLHPVPGSGGRRCVRVRFDERCGRTVIATIQLGVPVARIELLDEVQMDAVNRYSKTELSRSRRHCSSSFTATRIGMSSEQAAAVEALASEHGGRGFEWATRLEDRERLWQARHNVHFAALALRPGCRSLGHRRLRADLAPVGVHGRDKGGPCRPRHLPCALVGHAGDGNFHVIYLLDPSSEAEMTEARRLNDRMVARALAMGGTCTGEHGVGYGKMKFLEAEHGEGLEVMRAIKRALDPDNRMNPGKVDM